MRNLLLVTIVNIVLLVCGIARDQSDKAGTVHDQITAVPSENGIPNFHSVHPFLFRSGEILGSDIDELAGWDVKTIVSLDDYGGDLTSAEAERIAADNAGIEFVWQPLSPKDPPSIDQIEAALKVIADPDNQPVLVHCSRGSDRTGIIIAAYRIRYDHWSTAHAIAELRNFGHPPDLYWWDDVLNQLPSVPSAS